MGRQAWLVAEPRNLEASPTFAFFRRLAVAKALLLRWVAQALQSI